MISSSDVRRAWSTWLAGLLSLVVSLGALIGSPSHEPLPTNSLVFPLAEVGLNPIPGEILVHAGDPLNEGAAEAHAPLVRALIKESIAQRLGNAQLSADLGIDGPHNNPPHGEAQLAGTTAPRAEIESGLLEQARVINKVSARARRQDAATKDQLRERDSRFADVRSGAEAPRQRVDAAYTDLKRKRAENNRLATEAASVGTDTMTVTATSNPAAIEGQTRVSQAAAEDIHVNRTEPPAGLLSSPVIGAIPVMPIQKSRIRGQASAPASNALDNGGPARAGKNAAVQDEASIQASSFEVAISNSEPMTAHKTSTTPDHPQIRDRRSTAALAPSPFPSNIVASNKSVAMNGLAGPLKGSDRRGLNEAAARLADGLRVTREEAISQRQERVFMVDVDKRAFATPSAAEPVPLDPAFNIHLLTANSELDGKSKGGIRFFADGSSTGGRIELDLLGQRAAINVQWSTGIVTIDR